MFLVAPSEGGRVKNWNLDFFNIFRKRQVVSKLYVYQFESVRLNQGKGGQNTHPLLPWIGLKSYLCNSTIFLNLALEVIFVLGIVPMVDVCEM